MKVYFIGAGPGAPDLLTLRAAETIRKCPIVLYAGSLIPTEILSHAQEGAEIYDSASMNLDEIMAILRRGAKTGKDIARLHSGDPALYGATAEQMNILRDEGIDFETIPGVTAYSAAAAKMNQELTMPNISQTVILTRTATRASAMPNAETLENFARTGSTLAIHLSITNLAKVVRELLPFYGETCPVLIAYRASWADEKYILGTLLDIRAKVKAENITRTALIFVGQVLGKHDSAPSHLYDKNHTHILRKSS